MAMPDTRNTHPAMPSSSSAAATVDEPPSSSEAL
jgi:hypothetical protein